MSNDTALLAESDHSGFEDALPSAENSIGGGAAPGTWKASEGMLSDLKKEEGTAPSCSQGRGSAASILEDHDDVIWENLEDIFADMDAGKDAKQDNRAVLREPLAQLRSLLALYNKIKERESRMASAHMGVLLERSWYHNKLCAIEEVMVREDMQSPENAALAGAIKSILYAEDAEFRLLATRGQGLNDLPPEMKSAEVSAAASAAYTE
eukprot:jgi/Mesvir1/24371/Mv11042-RA.1